MTNEMNEDGPNDVLAGREAESEDGVLLLSSLETVVDNAEQTTMEWSESDSERYEKEEERNNEAVNGRNGKKNVLSARWIMKMFHTSGRERATIGIKNLKKIMSVG